MKERKKKQRQCGLGGDELKNPTVAAEGQAGGGAAMEGLPMLPGKGTSCISAHPDVVRRCRRPLSVTRAQPRSFLPGSANPPGTHCSGRDQGANRAHTASCKQARVDLTVR